MLTGIYRGTNFQESMVGIMRADLKGYSFSGDRLSCW